MGGLYPSAGTVRPADNTGRETHVTGHSASLPTFALLGKDTPRPGSQGRKLELSRYSGMDAAPEADAGDRRLSRERRSFKSGGSSSAIRFTFSEPSKNWALRARFIRKARKVLQKLLAGGARRGPSSMSSVSRS